MLIARLCPFRDLGSSAIHQLEAGVGGMRADLFVLERAQTAQRNAA